MDRSKQKNVSPLRYPGGKTRAVHKLEEVMSTHFEIDSFSTIISPFFGGGSFEFHIQNKYKLKILANDKFKPLYSFWNVCKNDNETLCSNLIEKLGHVGQDEFKRYRNGILQEQNELTQALMYFIINRCSFSGSTLSGGFSLESSKRRYTQSSIDRIRKLNLLPFDIYNMDFEEFINSVNKQESFMFLDPPYYLKSSKLYGNNGDMHEHFSHEKLHKCLSTKTNWMMTYNNCDYIKEMYKEFKIIETSWSYGMNKSKLSSEIIILSNKKDS